MTVRCRICRRAPAIPGRYYCSWACRDMDMDPQCLGCGGPLRTVRRDAEYCSNACRQRAYRAARDWRLDNEAKLAALQSENSFRGPDGTYSCVRAVTKRGAGD